MKVPGITLVGPSSERTIPAIVRRAARLFGDRPFLGSDAAAGYFSFADFERQTAALAVGLRELVEPGDYVGLHVPTTAEALLAQYALIRAGAIPVLISDRYDGALLRSAVATTLPGRLALAPRAWLPRLPETVDGYAIEDLPRGDPRDHRDPAPASGDLCMVLPTSGTTGISKGVLIPHNHAIHYAECGIVARILTSADAVHAFTPIHHADGQFANVLAPLIVGARTRLVRTPSTRSFWADCRAHGLTTFSYAGGLIAILGAAPRRADDADNPVRIAFGAPSPPARARDFERRFGLRLREAYGSTECGIPLLAPLDGSRIEEASCGCAATGYDVRLAAGGELLVRGHFPHMWMAGYVNDDAATRARLPGDGWLHTGDVLEDIGGGHYAFRGRMEDTIRRRGEFIPPAVIEQAAEASTQVLEAAAYGIDADEGEQLVALAVTSTAGSIDLQGLRFHLRRHLPRFMVPERIFEIDEFPRSPGSGKVRKHLLPEATGTSEPNSTTEAQEVET